MLGLPTEGSVGDRDRIAAFARPVESVPIDATIADVRSLTPSTMPVPVLGPGNVLLGAVSPVASDIDPRTPVEQIMVTAPGTIRPDGRVADVSRQLADDHLDHVFVTTVAGELVGIVITDQLHI